MLDLNFSISAVLTAALIESAPPHPVNHPQQKQVEKKDNYRKLNA